MLCYDDIAVIDVVDIVADVVVLIRDLDPSGWSQAEGCRLARLQVVVVVLLFLAGLGSAQCQTTKRR